MMTTDESQAQRGDLVIYNTGAHIGIYLGDGRVISALINPFGVTVHSLHGVNVPVTGFLRPDWSGEGEVAPFVPDRPICPTFRKLRSTLVPGADWMPVLDPALSAPAQREGNEVVDLRTLNSRTFQNAMERSRPSSTLSRSSTSRPARPSAPISSRSTSHSSADKKSGTAAVANSPVAVTTRPANDANGFVTATVDRCCRSACVLATDAACSLEVGAHDP